MIKSAKILGVVFRRNPAVQTKREGTMQVATPSLKQVVGLIKIYTGYENDNAIAKRLNWSPRRLSESWRGESRDWSIPEHKFADFKSLFSEILPIEVTEADTKVYLQSAPVLFHMAISPISGKAWACLINRHSENPKLHVHKMLPGLGFGKSDYREKQLPDAELALNEKFVLKGKIAFSPSEIIIAAEHQSVWHLIPYTSNDSDRILNERGGGFAFPPKIEGEQCSLFEDTSPGYYRYFAIIVRGGFPNSLHELLHSVNPISQSRLDMIGNVLNSEPQANVAILGATISIVGTRAC